MSSFHLNDYIRYGNSDSGLVNSLQFGRQVLRAKAWNHVTRSHDDYLLYSGECPETDECKKRRSNLISNIEVYLSEVEPNRRYDYEAFSIILEKSVGKLHSFDARKAALAFATMERYALNLLNFPWREELKTIKLYNGSFTHFIDHQLSDATLILRLLGYERSLTHDGVMVLNGPLDLRRARDISLNCIIAQVQCQMMIEINKRVKQATWKDIFKLCSKYAFSVELVTKHLRDYFGESAQRSVNQAYFTMPTYPATEGRRAERRQLLLSGRSATQPSVANIGDVRESPPPSQSRGIVNGNLNKSYDSAWLPNGHHTSAFRVSTIDEIYKQEPTPVRSTPSSTATMPQPARASAMRNQQNSEAMKEALRYDDGFSSSLPTSGIGQVTAKLSIMDMRNQTPDVKPQFDNHQGRCRNSTYDNMPIFMTRSLSRPPPPPGLVFKNLGEDVKDDVIDNMVATLLNGENRVGKPNHENGVGDGKSIRNAASREHRIPISIEPRERSNGFNAGKICMHCGTFCDKSKLICPKCRKFFVEESPAQQPKSDEVTCWSCSQTNSKYAPKCKKCRVSLSTEGTVI